MASRQVAARIVVSAVPEGGWNVRVLVENKPVWANFASDYKELKRSLDDAAKKRTQLLKLKVAAPLELDPKTLFLNEQHTTHTSKAAVRKERKELKKKAAKPNDANPWATDNGQREAERKELEGKSP